MVGACYNDTLNNTLYFGAREGYISFDPESIHEGQIYPETAFFEPLYLGAEDVPIEVDKRGFT